MSDKEDQTGAGRDSACRTGNLGEGNQQAHFTRQEESGVSFDLSFLLGRGGTAPGGVEWERGRPRTGLASLSGSSAWKQLQREQQTLTHPRKAAQRGPRLRKQASPTALRSGRQGRAKTGGRKAGKKQQRKVKKRREKRNKRQRGCFPQFKNLCADSKVSSIYWYGCRPLIITGVTRGPRRLALG